MLSNRISRGVLQVAGGSLLLTGMAFAQSTGTAQGTQGTPSQGMSGAQNKPNATRGLDDPTQPTTMNSAGQGMMADKKFVHGALQGGMAEVELGKLALEKSSNDDVKKFAQRMIDDHTKLGDDMKPVAEQLGVNMPTGLSKKDMALEARLKTLSGAQFDKAYVQAMLKDHKKDYAEFQQESKSASNPAVKQAAQSGEPVIKSHLDEVEHLSKTTSGSASMQ